jgi:hypothetical protein
MNVSFYCSQLEQVLKVRPNILPLVSKGRVYDDKRLFSHEVWTEKLKNTAILSIPFFKTMRAPDNEHGVPLVSFTVSRYLQHLTEAVSSGYMVSHISVLVFASRGDRPGPAGMLQVEQNVVSSCRMLA